MNDEFYKEEFFYSQNGSPTEIYKYCPYHWIAMEMIIISLLS